MNLLINAKRVCRSISLFSLVNVTLLASSEDTMQVKMRKNSTYMNANLHIQWKTRFINHSQQIKNKDEDLKGLIMYIEIRRKRGKLPLLIIFVHFYGSNLQSRPVTQCGGSTCSSIETLRVKMQSSITKHRSQLKLNYTFIS
jgi:hypothetical protein